MDSKLKVIINKVIDREYNLVMDDYADYLKETPELDKEDKEYAGIFENSLKKLYEIVPEEYHDLLNDIDSSSNRLMDIEAKVAFKQGISLGLNELSYLKELFPGIIFI